MKRLMKEIVNNIFTFLCRQDEQSFIERCVQMGTIMRHIGTGQSSGRTLRSRTPAPVAKHEVARAGAFRIGRDAASRASKIGQQRQRPGGLVLVHQRVL
jgi:hypothetical protein